MNDHQSIIKKNRIIYFLALALLVVVLFLFRYEVHDFVAPYPPYAQGDSMYNIYAGKYRWKLFGSRKPYGSWYDTGSFKKYIDVTLPGLINNMKGRSGYQWGVGFYFMRKKMSDGTKSWDFCILPTLRNSSPTDSTVLDFFDEANCDYYSRCAPKGGLSGNGNVGVDAGQLWP
jgi:hypothetical protein